MALASVAGGRYVTVESCRFREIMTEQLPVELREQFTEMREMDLQVQNTIDDLDIRVKQFFMTCRKAKPEWKEQQYKQIREEYQKALEDADEKVTIASQIYDLVDRHLRKLDQELSKFKMELEADSAGITEMLEQRSLRLDEPLNPPSPAVNNQYTPTHSHPSIGQKRQFSHVDSLSNELVNGDHLAVPTIRDYPSYSPLGAYNQMSPSPKASAPQPPSPSLIALGSSGTGSAAVAVAAAQAVSTTLQMNRRGGGTLKAPYVTALGGALGGLSGATGSLNGIPSSSGSINLSSYDTTHTSVVGNITLPLVPSEAQSAMSGSSSKQKRQRNKGPALQTSTAAAAAQVQADQAAAAAAAVPDWVYDPNEPRYCLCNQVSYGEMVGCDNSECPIEWFHYGCVGITDPPKGKWYCPQCSVQIKQKRGGRHK